MRVFKCDRCGGYYEDIQGNIKVKSWINSPYLDKPHLGPMDLCPKCAEELKIFLCGSAYDKVDEDDE